MLFGVFQGADDNDGYHVKLLRKRMRFEHLIGAAERAILGWERPLLSSGIRWSCFGASS